jgi:hypothetical protein
MSCDSLCGILGYVIGSMIVWIGLLIYTLIKEREK